MLWTIRAWLIQLLAHNSTVIIGANFVNGALVIPSTQPAIVIRSTFDNTQIQIAAQSATPRDTAHVRGL